MLRMRVAAYGFALLLLAVGLVPVLLTSGQGALGTPTPSAVAWWATCWLMALAIGMLPLLTPRRY